MIKVITKKMNINPVNPTYIGGHAMRTGKFTGIHDDLEIMIMWLEINEKKALLVNADLSGFDYGFVHEAKRKIINCVDVNPDMIVLSTGHTHSGPIINTRNKNQPHDEEYRQLVLDRLVEGAVSSYGQGKAVAKVTCRKGEVYGFYGNRNSKEKAGDQWIEVIEFKDEFDKTIEAWVHMSCHSTVLSPEEYNLSADLMGAVRRKLIPVLGVEPLMANGNAGDMSNRLYRQNNDFNELERVSQGIADAVSHFDQPFELNMDDLQVKTFRFNVEYTTDKETLETKLSEFEEKLETTIEYDDRKWLISEINGFKRKLAVDEVKLDFETTILRFGDLEVIALPCELVTAFGFQIKRASNAKVCFNWCYANGQTTYVVEASEFDGGHDGISTNLPKGKAEEFVGQIIQHLF